MELEINFKADEGKISGFYLSKLSRDGETYSENRGRGYNNAVKIIPGSETHYLLQMSPDSFLDVVKTEDPRVLIGKFYNSDAYAGLVKLYRK